MNQYATNNNPSHSVDYDVACAVAYEAGFAHGLLGNKGLPRTMMVKGIFINRNGGGSGFELRLGHKQGYATFLAAKA